MHNSLLGITIEPLTKIEVLEKIKRYINQPKDIFHIVSLNPENLVIAQKDAQFRKVLTEAQIKIVDGVGVVLAASLLNIEAGERIAGVTLMISLLKLANDGRLGVMLIGGKPKVADNVVKCQRDSFPQVKFYSLEGFKDIKSIKREEEEKIFSIVASVKPHFLFVAFGSPYQELWLYQNRHQLRGVVCMGVGGAFDFLSGKALRAPQLVRQIGLEWLFRLII